MIRYNKHTAHLKPYVDSALTYLEVAYKLPQIRSVIGYTLPEGTDVQSLGACHKSPRGRHDITLYMGVTGKKKYAPFEGILTTLAHEIAHTLEWEHTGNHWKLMCNIMNNWGDIIEYHVEDTSQGHRQK